MLGLRKPNFKTKINHFEISHNAEHCKRGPFEILLQNVKKMKRNPLESEKFSKKKTKNENF